MKYFSEITNKVYNTTEDLAAAEAKVELEKKAEEKKKQLRAERAKEVEDAFKAANEAYKKASDLLSDFTKTYGSFHMSLKADDFAFPGFSFFDLFW